MRWLWVSIFRSWFDCGVIVFPVGLNSRFDILCWPSREIRRLMNSSHVIWKLVWSGWKITLVWAVCNCLYVLYYTLCSILVRIPERLAMPCKSSSENTTHLLPVCLQQPSPCFSEDIKGKQATYSNLIPNKGDALALISSHSSPDQPTSPYPWIPEVSYAPD